LSVIGIARLEHFFRAAAGLDVDKEDLRRLSLFIDRKIHDLLLRAQAIAKANGRDVIEVQDLPIGKGLQECMQTFKSIDRQIDVQPVFEALTHQPPLDLTYAEGVASELPVVAGGLSVALARGFKEVTPGLRNPQSAHWATAFRLFDLLL
jgi:hypothetical protein